MSQDTAFEERRFVLPNPVRLGLASKKQALLVARNERHVHVWLGRHTRLIGCAVGIGEAGTAGERGGVPVAPPKMLGLSRFARHLEPRRTPRCEARSSTTAFAGADVVARSHQDERPCCISCKASFAEGAEVGLLLFSTAAVLPTSASVSGICTDCARDLSPDDIERVCTRALRRLMPKGRFHPEDDAR